MIRATLLLGLLASPFAGPVYTAEICIENQTGKTLFMVADLNASKRQSNDITAGQSLCLSVPEDTQKAVVSAYLNDEVVEGCSRLTRPGQRETLLKFQEFDNCSWAATPRGF